MTGFAAFPSRDLELGFFSVDGFFKGQFQIVLQVVALFRVTVASSRSSEEVFENITENVAKTATEIEPFGSPESLRPC